MAGIKIKPHYDHAGITIYNGHVLDVLKQMEGESVHCVVTSPPYWGLRDYGIEPQIWPCGCEIDHSQGCEHEWENGPKCIDDGQHAGAIYGAHGVKKETRERTIAGQFCLKCNAWKGSLGLEPTPELYIQHMVEIFREVRRVLRKDGTVFLNLGDSYMGSGRAYKEHHKNPGLSKSFERGGVPCEVSCGTSGRALGDSQDCGCLCENLCDGCREVYQKNRFRNGGLLVSKLISSLSLPNQESKELENYHFATSDFSLLENHILTSIRDSERFFYPEDELLHAFLESMPDLFFQRLLGECWQRGKHAYCLFCGYSLIDGVQQSLDKSVCTCGIEKPADASNHHKLDKVSLDSAYQSLTNPLPNVNLKPKDLCGIPWRVALALQADGWWLRSDIIWSKPNPMPESVTDRPTRSHEYIFLLTKSARYFYDADAVKEKANYPTGPNAPDKIKSPYAQGLRKYYTSKMAGGGSGIKGHSGAYKPDGTPIYTDTRNKRSVWTITTQPFPEAHFATFPEEIPRTCILAGTSEKGCCPECGSPWKRITENKPMVIRRSDRREKMGMGYAAGTPASGTMINPPESKTIGWKPTCSCILKQGYDVLNNLKNAKIVPCTVLDPFMGSGRTLIVAKKLRRRAIGIELNPDYCEMPIDDLAQDFLPFPVGGN